MNNIMFWLQPFVAAFIGWFTIRIAIYMLFHPLHPKRFLGITIQGIFPKKQKQMAAQLGTMVAKELFHFDDIADKLKDYDQLKALNPTIEKHLDHFLAVKLKEKLPVISVFVGESTLAKIKEGMLEEIELLLPEIISQYTESMGRNINIEEIVTEKVAAYPPEKLEQGIQSVLKKESGMIGLFGALIGFIIGLIQMSLSLL